MGRGLSWITVHLRLKNSHVISEGWTARRRGHAQGIGFTEEDMHKPFIGVRTLDRDHALQFNLGSWRPR